jgi:hypothetical protein
MWVLTVFLKDINLMELVGSYFHLYRESKWWVTVLIFSSFALHVPPIQHDSHTHNKTEVSPSWFYNFLQNPWALYDSIQRVTK